MIAIAWLLVLLKYIILTILPLIAPFVVSKLLYILLRRFGIGFKPSVVGSVTPVFLFYAWAVSGLIGLCGNQDSISALNLPQKLESIDSVLIDGPGMWYFNSKINVERPAGKNKFQVLKATIHGKPEGTKNGFQPISEAELRSKYKITIKKPEGGDFFHRYRTNATITIENRLNGTVVAKINEPAWGGGLAGLYIGTFRIFSSPSMDNYMSCGYAGNQLGLYRGESQRRRELYITADQKLIQKVFSMP